MKLPNINLETVADKGLIHKLLNIIEHAQQIRKLNKALEEANQTIAWLKGQPKKPRGEIYQPQFPEGTKGVSFDNAIQTLSSQLKFDGKFTHPLLYRFFRSFGIHISYGEPTHILKRNSRKLLLSFLHLRRIGIKKSAYTQTDATGIKRMLTCGKMINQYLSILGHKFLSIFKITRKYNGNNLTPCLERQGRKSH